MIYCKSNWQTSRGTKSHFTLFEKVSSWLSTRLATSMKYCIIRPCNTIPPFTHWYLNYKWSRIQKFNEIAIFTNEENVFTSENIVDHYFTRNVARFYGKLPSWLRFLLDHHLIMNEIFLIELENKNLWSVTDFLLQGVELSLFSMYNGWSRPSYSAFFSLVNI